MPDPPQLAAAARPSSCSWRPGRARGSPGVAAADTPEIRLLPWLLGCAPTLGMERRGEARRPRRGQTGTVRFGASAAFVCRANVHGWRTTRAPWCATPSIIFAGEAPAAGREAFAGLEVHCLLVGLLAQMERLDTWTAMRLRTY